MENCTFCKIVAGTLPSNKVYEDTEAVAFLDIRPFAAGHTLVIAKEHGASITEGGDRFGRAVGLKLAKIAAGVVRATGAESFNLLLADGPAAGQEIPHAHVHVIPRRAGDGLRFSPPGSGIGADQALADRIAKAISE